MIMTGLFVIRQVNSYLNSELPKQNFRNFSRSSGPELDCLPSMGDCQIDDPLSTSRQKFAKILKLRISIRARIAKQLVPVCRTPVSSSERSFSGSFQSVGLRWIPVSGAPWVKLQFWVSSCEWWFGKALWRFRSEKWEFDFVNSWGMYVGKLETVQTIYKSHTNHRTYDNWSLQFFRGVKVSSA